MLRVASVAPVARQIPAVCASATPMVHPSRSLRETIPAYRPAAGSSKARIRPWKSSLSNP